MKITFELNTKNAAFTDAYLGLAGETARILEVFSARVKELDSGEVIGFTHPLHDALGNRVGIATIESTEA